MLPAATLQAASRTVDTGGVVATSSYSKFTHSEIKLSILEFLKSHRIEIRISKTRWNYDELRTCWTPPKQQWHLKLKALNHCENHRTMKRLQRNYWTSKDSRNYSNIQTNIICMVFSMSFYWSSDFLMVFCLILTLQTGTTGRREVSHLRSVRSPQVLGSCHACRNGARSCGSKPDGF